MRTLFDKRNERLAVNSGWLDWRVLGFMFLAVFVAPGFIGARYGFVPAAIVIGVTAWRLLPNLLLMKEIRALAKRM